MCDSSARSKVGGGEPLPLSRPILDIVKKDHGIAPATGRICALLEHQEVEEEDQQNLLSAIRQSRVAVLTDLAGDCSPRAWPPCSSVGLLAGLAHQNLALREKLVIRHDSDPVEAGV
jgi:hypothetical protein